NHLIAIERAAVPAAMLADEDAVGELWRQRLTLAEGETKRGDMRAEAVIRLDRFRDHIRFLGMDAHVDVLSPIAVRPAIEAAIPDRCKIVRHEVGTDLVALIGDGEQLAGSRLDREVSRIAHARRIDALCAGHAVDLVDGRPALLS